MNAWDSTKKGLEYLAGLSNPSEDMWELANNLGKSTADYTKQGTKAKQDTENAKGELAQMASAGSNKSDELLEIGIPGLQFFDVYLPLYNDWKGTSIDLEKDIYSKYRKLYGINFAAFRRDVGALQGSYNVMLDTYAEIDAKFRGLVANWSGNAAVAATDHMSKFLEAGHSFQEGVNTLQRNVGHHVTAMEKVVKSCSESALELYSMDCGGEMPPTIKQYIKMARNESGMTLNDTVGLVVDNFGNTVKGIGNAIPIVGSYSGPAVDAFKEMSNKGESILNNNFVPAFESKLNKFNNIVCQKTQDDLRRLWDEFGAASTRIPKDPFTQVSPLVSM